MLSASRTVELATDYSSIMQNVKIHVMFVFHLVDENGNFFNGVCLENIDESKKMALMEAY